MLFLCACKILAHMLKSSRQSWKGIKKYSQSILPKRPLWCSILLEVESSTCLVGNNEAQWTTQGHSLPRKLLQFPSQVLSAFYLWLSLDSFEAAIKRPTKAVCRCHWERGHVGSRSLIFISLLAFVSPFMLILSSRATIKLWGGAKAHHLKIHLDAKWRRDWSFSLSKENKSKWVIWVCEGWQTHQRTL